MKKNGCFFLTLLIFQTFTLAMQAPVGKSAAGPKADHDFRPWLSGNKPEAVLVYDSKNDGLKENFSFLYDKSGDENQKVSYLALDPVEKNNYQYAYFVDKGRVLNMGKSKKELPYTINSFALVLAADDTVRIRCQHGEESYLAVKPVSPGSYQSAFFATEEYLEQNKSYISHFKISVDSKTRTYSLMSKEGEQPIYLATKKVENESYEWAFFSSLEYLKSLDLSMFSFSFGLDPYSK